MDVYSFGVLLHVVMTQRPRAFNPGLEPTPLWPIIEDLGWRRANSPTDASFDARDWVNIDEESPVPETTGATGDTDVVDESPETEPTCEDEHCHETTGIEGAGAKKVSIKARNVLTDLGSRGLWEDPG
jgi:hypothetical protein